MDSKAKKLAEDHYRLVEETMKKYKLSEYDTPDWHGALSVGLCVAAERWFDDAYDKFKTASFEDFAIPYMVISVSGEKPVRAVLKKVRGMFGDLTKPQKDHVLAICFKEGDVATVNIFTTDSDDVRWIVSADDNYLN